jgi:hypothetical protein
MAEGTQIKAKITAAGRATLGTEMGLDMEGRVMRAGR